MNSKMFLYVDNITPSIIDDSFVGIVQCDVSTVDKLLLLIADVLKFPGYFGENWNALSDCLRDFHWVEERVITLIHRETPNIGKQDLKIYIDVLAACVSDWKEGEDHKLVVVFPKDDEGMIESLVSRYSS